MDRRPAPPSSNKNSSRPHCRKLLLRGSPIGRPETVHDGTPRAAGPIVPLHPRGVPKLGIRPQQRPAAAQPSCRAGMAAIRFLHQGHSVPSVSDGRSSAPVRRINAGTLTCSFHTPRSFRSNMFHFWPKTTGAAPQSFGWGAAPVTPQSAEAALRVALEGPDGPPGAALPITLPERVVPAQLHQAVPFLPLVLPIPCHRHTARSFLYFVFDFLLIAVYNTSIHESNESFLCLS